MPVENATYIKDLNADWPVGKSDFVSEGDDHFRMMKKTLQNTIPNADAPITGTPTQLNNLTNAINWVDNSATAGAASYFEVTDPTSTDDTPPDAPLAVGTPTVTQFNSVPEMALNWQTLMDIIYPVGNPFMSATDNRNPADILGFGTWSPLVGLMAGVGTATDTHGASFAFAAGAQPGYLRVGEEHIVAMSHTPTFTGNYVGPHNHGMGMVNKPNGNGGQVVSPGGSEGYGYTDEGGGFTPSGTVSEVAFGSGDQINGQAFVNPYYGMYIWIRTA